MSSATLPKEIEKIAQESRQIQNDLIANKLEFGSDGKAIIPKDNAEEQPNATQDGKGEAAGETKKKQSVKKKQKVDDGKSSSEDEKTSEENKDNTPEYWKNRFAAMENMNKTTIKDLQAQVTKQKEEIELSDSLLASQQNAKVEEAKKETFAAEETVKPEIQKTEIPQDVIDIWGDEQYKFIRQVFASEISPLINRVHALEQRENLVDTISERLNRVVQTQETQETNTYNGLLASLCPDWEEYAMHKEGSYFPQFWNWADKTRIPKTSMTYGQQIHDAHKKGNAEIVAEIVNEFKALAGLSAPTVSTGNNAVSTDNSNSSTAGDEETATIEEQVVALDAGGDSIPDGDKSQHYKESELAKIYDDILRGNYTEDEAIAIKRRIAKDIREGTLVRDLPPQ